MDNERGEELGGVQMKPLLIGEAPSKNEPWPRPLEGRVGQRLARFAGISFEEYLERFDRVNLLDVRQDTKEKGFEFDRYTATINANNIMASLSNERVVVLLGKRVADAVGAVGPYFWLHRLERGITLYVVPHPSGVNRLFNDPVVCQRMEYFMRSLL